MNEWNEILEKLNEDPKKSEEASLEKILLENFKMPQTEILDEILAKSTEESLIKRDFFFMKIIVINILKNF